MCELTDGQEELRMRKVWTLRSQDQLELDLRWTYYLHYTVDVLSGTGGGAFVSGEKSSIPIFFAPPCLSCTSPPSLPCDSIQLSHLVSRGCPWHRTPSDFTLKSPTNCWSHCVLCFHVFTALSGSSSNAKYDPDQIKVEIACRRERVSHYQRRTMDCRERAFRIEKGLGCGPCRILWLWPRGFERMRMRSSSKGQAEARSLARHTHRKGWT